MSAASFGSTAWPSSQAASSIFGSSSQRNSHHGTSASVRTRSWISRRERVSGGDAPRARRRAGTARPARRTSAGQRPDVLGVEVVELLDVEERRRRVDVLEPERSTISLDRPDLDAVGRAPAEQRPGSCPSPRAGSRGPGSRRPATSSRRLDSFLRCSLTSSGRWANTGPVVEAEGVREQEVLRRAVDVVLAADHVGDAHVGVVDGVGQQEHRRAVRRGAITKSSRSAFANSTSPRTRSSKAVTPSSGVRKRSARPVAGLEAAVAAEAVVARRAAPLLGPGLDLPRACSRRVGRARRLAAARPPRRRRRPRSDWWTGSLVPVEAEPARASRRWRRSARAGCARCRCPRCAAGTRRPVWRANSQLNSAVRAPPDVQVAGRGRREAGNAVPRGRAPRSVTSSHAYRSHPDRSRGQTRSSRDAPVGAVGCRRPPAGRQAQAWPRARRRRRPAARGSGAGWRTSSNSGWRSSTSSARRRRRGSPRP